MTTTINVIVETPEGVVIGTTSRSVERDALHTVYKEVEKLIMEGSGIVVDAKEGALTYLPNSLLRQSVIRFRDTSKDAPRPF